jgi:radial spoke head protein 4/6
MSTNAERLQLVGKIHGQNKDYWITSGVLLEPEESGRPANMEKRCEGVNQLVYWVTDNLLNDWIQLPDCQPEHIVAARKIKVFLTGDLNADVNSNPAFPGKERHLLRAQIARIFAATTIAPAGAYVVDDETQKMKFAGADWTIPSTEELQKLESWQHINMNILQVGRTKYYVPDSVPEEERAEYVEKFKADNKIDEPEVELFKPINEDTPVEGIGAELSWVVKLAGDSCNYTKADGEGKVYSYAVNVLKSLRWPGAITVCKDGKWWNFYMGSGMKRTGPSFEPTAPPQIDSEPTDPVEQPEPTPFNEPKPVEEENPEPADDE